MDALLALDPIVVAYTAMGLCLFATLLMLIILIRQTRLLRRYRLLLNGETGRDLEAILLAQGADLEQTKQVLLTLTTRIDGLARDAESHVQKVGVVRFNAFPDTGSDLSFAIALLDAHNNGFVFSSLYSRSESRVYAKPLRGGESTYAISVEERQAITMAMGRS